LALNEKVRTRYEIHFTFIKIYTRNQIYNYDGLAIIYYCRIFFKHYNYCFGMHQFEIRGYTDEFGNFVYKLPLSAYN